MQTGDWIELAGAGTTLLAVIVAFVAAFFQEDFRRSRTRPHVRPGLETRTFPVLDRNPDGDKTHLVAYVRLRITVEPGRGSARGLQVILVDCDPPPWTGDQPAAEGKNMLAGLRWAFSHAASADLPGGGEGFVDLIEVSARQPEWARLTLVSAPREGIRLPGREEPYAINLRIVGENILPIPYTVAIRHDGIWKGKAEHLGGHLEAEPTGSNARAA